jgi:hypothetical protein
LADSYNPGDYAAWDRSTIRGPRRGRYLGTEADAATGEAVDVYSIADDEFEGTLPDFENDMFNPRRR